jgi:hypothetical protein
MNRVHLGKSLDVGATLDRQLAEEIMDVDYIWDDSVDHTAQIATNVSAHLLPLHLVGYVYGECCSS